MSQWEDVRIKSFTIGFGLLDDLGTREWGGLHWKHKSACRSSRRWQLVHLAFPGSRTGRGNDQGGTPYSTLAVPILIMPGHQPLLVPPLLKGTLWCKSCSKYWSNCQLRFGKISPWSQLWEAAVLWESKNTEKKGRYHSMKKKSNLTTAWLKKEPWWPRPPTLPGTAKSRT